MVLTGAKPSYIFLIFIFLQNVIPKYFAEIPNQMKHFDWEANQNCSEPNFSTMYILGEVCALVTRHKGPIYPIYTCF